jgi:hypothetical protein
MAAASAWVKERERAWAVAMGRDSAIPLAGVMVGASARAKELAWASGTEWTLDAEALRSLPGEPRHFVSCFG